MLLEKKSPTRLAGEGDGLEVASELRERHDVPSFLMRGTAHAILPQRTGDARPLGDRIKLYTELTYQAVHERRFAWIAHSVRECATADPSINTG